MSELKEHEKPRPGDPLQPDWIAQGKAIFGDDFMKWRSKCPSCGNVASLQEYKDAGAKHADSGFFNCIGRYLDKKVSDIGGKPPCNYTSGGLFVLNNVFVIVDGKRVPAFEFAEPET